VLGLQAMHIRAGRAWRSKKPFFYLGA